MENQNSILHVFSKDKEEPRINIKEFKLQYYSSLKNLLETLHIKPSALVLLDLNSLAGDVESFILQIKSTYPKTKLFLLVDEIDSKEIIDYIEKGFTNVIFRDSIHEFNFKKHLSTLVNDMNQFILSNISEGMIVINKEFTVLNQNSNWFNANFRTQDGFQIGIGDNYLEKIKNILNSSECQTKIAKGIQKIIDGGNSFKHTCELKINDKTHYYLIVAKNIERQNGLILISHKDITQRILIKNSVVKNEEKFRYLVENSSDAITVLDSNGVVKYTSANTEDV